jgi:hypothetical protein
MLILWTDELASVEAQFMPRCGTLSSLIPRRRGRPGGRSR